MMKKLLLAIALLGALSVGAAHAADEPRMSVKERMKMFEQDNSNEAGPSSARPKPASPAKQNFLKITARETLNADEDETFTLETFSDLITEQLNNNHMFVLARVTSQGPDREFVHYFDAGSFIQYYEKNQTDPLNRQQIIGIEYYTISRPGQKTFEYLGKHTPENIQTIKQNYGAADQAATAPQEQPAPPQAVSENLIEAARTGNINTAQMLLMEAARTGNINAVQMLIAAGTDLNLQNNGGITALMMAAAQDHNDIVQMLITAGANLNLQEDNGITALMMAITAGHNDIVQMLIDAGADLNLQDRFGSTALMYAIMFAHTDIVAMLIAAGADRNLQNNDGLTAIDMVQQLYPTSNEQ